MRLRTAGDGDAGALGAGPPRPPTCAPSIGRRAPTRRCRLAKGTARLALILVLAGFRTGSAETLQLTLREAIARALADGTAARIASERVLGAEAAARIERAPLLPALDASVRGGSQIVNLKTFGFTPPGVSPLVGPFSTVDARIAAALRLVDVAAGRRFEAARHAVRVSGSELRATENDVAAAVATLYVALQRFAAKVDQARANVELFAKLRDLARDREKAGVAIHLDTLRAEVQLAREKQALLVAQNDLDVARLALLHAIGAELGADVRPSDRLREVGAPFATVPEALEAARADRPELAASRERIRAARLRLSAAEAERWPVVSLEAYASSNGNGPNDLDTTYLAEGALTLPIFSGGRIAGEISAARAEVHELDLQRIELQRQVDEDVRRSLLSYRSARNRVRVASEASRLAAAELDVARDRFANGFSTSIDVDNAQTALSAAENARIDAVADEAQAEIDVRKATGRIRELLPPE